MQLHQQQTIDYFRRCYRADSYDLSLSNIDKIRNDRRLFIDDEDVLACGELPRLPVVKAPAASMQEQADTYRKERRLIYACLMVKGELEIASGFAKQRKIHSPLFYFPATLVTDEDLYVEIDNSDIRVNTPLLRLLLKADVDTAVTDSFPALEWPVNHKQMTLISRWLREYTLVADIEELARWPSLSLGEHSGVKTDGDAPLRIRASCCVLLAERSRGSRGVLHELNALLASPSLSAPLQGILGAEGGAAVNGRSQPELLPGLLSAAQKSSLENAAKYPLSLISGPPGTGKSFTIAAIAIDRMLQGESVLIVSKTDQAIDVIGEKLKSEFGLSTGYVHASNQSFLKTMKVYLDALLKEGVSEKGAVGDLAAKLKNTHSNLSSLEKTFTRSLWAVKQAGNASAPWYKRQLGTVYRAVKDDDVLWSSQREIGQVQDDFEADAINYINACRSAQLKAVLNKHRDVLVSFHQGLRARSSKQQAQRFAATDFDVVLKALPIWLVSVDEINRVLPFTQGLFDVLIVDESTQCDIASSLPALQRAKRAVVVGDSKQLRHVSFLSRAKQAQLWAKAGLPGDARDGYSYRDQSLLDFVSDAIAT
ncbi:MAG: AAA family ATPase, partial [Pseudomonadales bacterium]|nr:AAA family ATPase [Pseudomonadales bacterium]